MTRSAPVHRPPARRRRRLIDYPRSYKRGLWRWLPSWRVVLGSFLVMFAVAAGFLVAAYRTTVVPSNLPEVTNETSTVLRADGSILTTFKAENQNREIIDCTELPDWVGNAVVASEDRTFWTNTGVDPKGILRAFINNLRGGQRQGASTLTQQYVEKYYTNDKNASYAGKLREAILAIKIARSQSKQEILGNYLNTIYFGRGAYGIQAASMTYFGEPATKLTLSQSAMLVGIIPAPVRWDPAVNPEQAQARWKRTLNLMAEDGYITAAQRDGAKFPYVKERTKEDQLGGTDGYLIKMVKDELENVAKLPEETYAARGYTIITTIDPIMQQLAVDTIVSLGEQNPPPSPQLRGALVSIEPRTGAIKALYGGPDYVTQAYNNSTQGKAQAGSTFKPFTLIGALEKGIKLNKQYDGANRQTVGTWKNVTNFKNANYGSIDLIRATAESVNTVYAQLNTDIDPETTAEVAHRAGITSDVNTYQSNVLGTDSVSALELANAYATIAASGQRPTPHIVASVTDKDGNVIYEAPTTGTPAFSPEVMDAATYALTQVVQSEKGSGHPAAKLGRPVAGKTGTSSDSDDPNRSMSAWFVGFIPQMVTVVGLYQVADDGGAAPIESFGEWARGKKTPDSITGGTWPVRAWAAYMSAVVEATNMPIEQFPSYTPPRSLAPSPSPSEEPSEEPTDEPTDAPSEFVTVPADLIGNSAQEAQDWLTANGLVPTVSLEWSSDYPSGIVLRILPSADIPLGSDVSVVVSRGPDPALTAPEPDPNQTE